MLPFYVSTNLLPIVYSNIESISKGIEINQILNAFQGYTFFLTALQDQVY